MAEQSVKVSTKGQAGPPLETPETDGRGWARVSGGRVRAKAALRGGKWAARAGGALLALNAADAALTHRFLTQGLATEANPLMRQAFDVSPVLFWLVKLALVGAAAVFLVSQRRRPGVPYTLLAAVCAYAAVLAYHLLLVGSGVLARGARLP